MQIFFMQFREAMKKLFLINQTPLVNFMEEDFHSFT